MKIKNTIPALAVLLVSSGLYAELRLPAIFGDHMVLQQEANVPVWGTAAPGQSVTVEFAGQKITATADANGRWMAVLAPLKASAEPRELAVTAEGKTLKVADVLVGEVWLCSGQSNMEWALGRCIGGDEAVAASANPMLRLCTIPHNSQMTPQEDVAAKWALSGPDSTKFFSAVAWWMGSQLQKELGVPVGIINDSYGGTTIQSWMPAETLRKGSWPQDKSTDIAMARADYEKRLAAMKPVMDKYLAEKAEAIKAKKAAPPMPAGWPGDFRGPSVLWNGMVAPILKFRVRGVAWYQGESNAYVGVADTYAALLPAMISAWRAGFGREDMPFILFQLSAFRKPQAAANEASGIALLREAQLKASRNVPHTALVVTLDLGEEDVHYKNKQPAGQRGMKAALALTGRSEAEFSGPVLKSHEIAGGKVTLRFTHCAGGLMAKNGPLAGFAIAGADRKFVFADANIEGDSVVVSSDKVVSPVAVRYAWADYPKANLCNQSGLPASTFRTDDWPITAGK